MRTWIRRHRRITGAAVLVVFAIVLWSLLSGGSEPTELSFTELEGKIAEGQIVEATILDRSHQVEGTLLSGEEFVASFPQEFTDELFAVPRRPRRLRPRRRT